VMHAPAKISRFKIEQSWLDFLPANVQKLGMTVFGCRI
jgi:hypothetical protein